MKIILFWKDHGTKILGVLLGTVTTLQASGVIPEADMKYYSAAAALLVFYRGFINSAMLEGKDDENSKG